MAKLKLNALQREILGAVKAVGAHCSFASIMLRIDKDAAFNDVQEATKQLTMWRYLLCETEERRWRTKHYWTLTDAGLLALQAAREGEELK